MTNMRLKNGVDFALEEEADRLLAENRKSISVISEKRDYLTKDQLQLRAQREITNQTGVCDESIVRGLFRKAYNPNFGKRPDGRASDD